MSKLSEFYNTAQNEAVGVLATMHNATECPVDDPDFPPNIASSEKWTVRKVKAEISDSKSIDLIVAIPPTYPDNLPKIYLSKSAFEELPRLPHVDSNRFICTRDTEVVFINDAKPGEAILELVNIAIHEILLPGIEGINRSDVDNEFLAYWNDICKHRCIGILPPPRDISHFKVYQLKSKLFDSQYAITDDTQRLKNWLIPFKVDIEEKHPWNVLTLHLPERMPFPLLRTNAEIFRFIKKCGKKYVQALEKFFSSDENNLVVFCSHQIDNQVVWYGLKFRPWPDHTLHGFPTLSKVPLEVRIAKTANESFDPISVERLDRDRLFDRIGLRLAGNKRIQVCLIGCGSIGSSIAYSLAKSGFDSFTLIDDDTLLIENIARHECGAVDARNCPPKVNALQSRLQSHFPYLLSEAIHCDVLQLMLRSPEALQAFDLIIMAVGKISVERRINFAAYKGEITAPIAYIWVEPYGLAGHLIWINSKYKGCFNCCFSENGEFKFSVAHPDNSFSFREAGCQSTFLPYSHLDVQHFVAYACRQLINLLEERPDSNMRFSFLGDKESFLSNGYSINESWAGNPSFTSFSRTIVPSSACNVCK